MKNFFLCLGVLLLVLPVSGQVTIVKYLPDPAPSVTQIRAPNGTPNHSTFRAHFILTAADMNGISNGVPISKVGFVLSGGTSVPASGNMRFYMENTGDAVNQKSTDWATAISSMTEVYNGLYTIPAGPSTPAEIILNIAPFIYTGGALYVAFDYLGTAFSTGNQDAATFRANSLLSGSLFMNSGASGTPMPTLNQSSSFRPQLRFDIPNPHTNDISVENITIEKAHPNKLTQSSDQVRSLIRNASNTALSNISINLDVTGANPAGMNQLIPFLDAGDTCTVSFGGLLLQNDGLQTLKVSVPADDDTLNNSRSVQQYIYCDTLGFCHNGPSDDAIGFNTSAGILAMRYTTEAFFPTIKGVSMRISGDPATAGKYVSGVILDKQGVILSLSPADTLSNADLGRELYFPFMAPQTIAAYDTFYTGILQYASAQGYYPIASQYPQLIPNDRVFAFADSGGPSVMYNNLGTLVIKAVLGSSVQIGNNTPDDSICMGQPVTWSASPGFGSYDFTINGNSAQQSASATYTVVPSAHSAVSVSAVYNNCIFYSGTDSVYVLPASGAQLAATICQGETYILGNQQLTTSGTYTEYFPVPGSACDSVVTLELQINTVDTSITQNGNTLRASAQGAAYAWFDCSSGMLIPGAAGQTFEPGSSGSYAVIVSQNGCTDTSACVSITSTAGLNSVSAPGNLYLYPNPAGDLLHAGLPGTEIRRVYISDINGRRLLAWPVQSSQATLNVSGLRPGLYLLQAETSAGTVVSRFIKQ